MEEGKLTGVWRAVKSKKLIVFLVAAGILLLAADLIFIRGSSDKIKAIFQLRFIPLIRRSLSDA
jgi:hypothetical protein